MRQNDEKQFSITSFYGPVNFNYQLKGLLAVEGLYLKNLCYSALSFVKILLIVLFKEI